MATAVPKEPLRELFMSLSGLPDAVVIFDGEPISPVAFSQDARRLVLSITAIRRIGQDQRKREFLSGYITRTTLKGQRIVTLQVRAENYGREEGYELLENLRTQLESPEVGETLNAAGFALNETQEILVLDVTAGNRAISVATLDVLLNWASTSVSQKVDPGGYIETVETTGQGQLAVAGLVTIPQP